MWTPVPFFGNTAKWADHQLYTVGSHSVEEFSIYFVISIVGLCPSMILTPILHRFWTEWLEPCDMSIIQYPWPFQSQVPRHHVAPRCTKAIEPRTYFQLVTRLRLWGFLHKALLRIFRSSDGKVSEITARCFRRLFNLRHCFVGYRLLANISYIHYIHEYVYIYIYLLYILYTYHHIIYHVVYNRHYRRGWETVSVRRVGWHPETTRRMLHGNARRFCECFSLGFWVVHLLMSAQKGPGHACHLFHVFLGSFCTACFKAFISSTVGFYNYTVLNRFNTWISIKCFIIFVHLEMSFFEPLVATLV